MTRELGERFLWIDSLYIVQDDPNDLNQQLHVMGEIFEGSYCTIAATDSEGIDGSMAVDRGLFLSGPNNFRTVTLELKDDNEGQSIALQKVFI